MVKGWSGWGVRPQGSRVGCFGLGGSKGFRLAYFGLEEAALLKPLCRNMQVSLDAIDRLWDLFLSLAQQFVRLDLKATKPDPSTAVKTIPYLLIGTLI